MIKYTYEFENGQITVYQGTKNYLLETAKEFEDEVTLRTTLDQLEVLGKGLLDFVRQERNNDTQTKD